MRFSSWLTRAGWLGAFAAVSLAGGALRADDGPATEEEETTEQSETAEAKSTAEEVKEAIRHAKEAARAASREAAKEAAEGTAACAPSSLPAPPLGTGCNFRWEACPRRSTRS